MASVLTTTLVDDDPTTIAGNGPDTPDDAVSAAEDDPAIDAVGFPRDGALYVYARGKGELLIDTTMTTLYPCKDRARKDLPIAHKGKSSKTLKITLDVKQSFFMKEIKLRDVLASLEDLSMRLKNRLKGSQLPTPSR